MKLVTEMEADDLIHKRMFDLFESMSQTEHIKIIHMLVGTAVFFSNGGENFLEYINNSKMLSEKESDLINTMYLNYVNQFKEMKKQK